MPTIKFVYADEKGSIKSLDYQGARDAKALVTYAADKAKALALKKLGAKPGGAAGSNSGKKKPSSSGVCTV